MTRYMRLATITTGRVNITKTTPPFRYHLHTSASKAAQGYGDAVGDPKGDNPLQQGSPSSATHNAEHPGPPSPSEGRGDSVESKQGNSQKAPEDASANSGGSRSIEAKETGSSLTGGQVKSADVSASKLNSNVEKHNKEFAEGYDRAPKTDAGKNLRE